MSNFTLVYAVWLKTGPWNGRKRGTAWARVVRGCRPRAATCLKRLSAGRMVPRYPTNRRTRGGDVVEAKQVQQTVARLLDELGSGDRDAVDKLFAILYDELKELAARQRRRWHGNYTLNTTALLHEAWLRLVGQSRIEVEGRAHFRALAARAMRHILCDYARDRATLKRGGQFEKLPFEDLLAIPDQGVLNESQSHTLLALDEALERLAQVDERQIRVVECRFFGGMTIEETAIALDISPRTVKRDWAMAQAWLHREIGHRV